MTRLSIGFSPCPNDTFMLDALVHGKIDTTFQFDIGLHDIEQLNTHSREGTFDIVKISCSNYPAVSNQYQILTSGAALGIGCGPLLVSKKQHNLASVRDLLIAIPGRYTTANLLLSIFFPEARNKKEILFSEIEKAIIEEKIDAGVLIHENRFTYQDRGLVKIVDLGEIWEKTTQAPIPLGCIVIRRSLDPAIQAAVNGLLSESIRYAFDFPEQIMPFVRSNAQEMDDFVMKQHIDLYVNKFSLDLGFVGRRAIELLFKKGFEFGLLPQIKQHIFVDSLHGKSA